MQDKLKTIKNELAGLINSHSLENGSNTPDFILAAYLLNCLTVFDHANNWNTAWHSKDGVPADWRENGPPTAVRAHDAGTDEGLKLTIPLANFEHTLQIRLNDHLVEMKPDYDDSIVGFNEAQRIVGDTFKEFTIPASHAAESAPQLDAEDPAEPVEDVVSRMCKAFEAANDGPDTVLGGYAKAMTAALAVAREGYVKLEDVEKAMYAQGNTEGGWPAYIKGVMVRLAPKPEPTLAEEIDKILLKHNIRTVTSENVVCNSAVSAELAALVERRTK